MGFFLEYFNEWQKKYFKILLKIWELFNIICFRVCIKESSVAKLGSVCRRVYRIFSHAYFHHRSIFDEFETETYLCVRFTQFVTKYNLMSKDNLIVPILEEDVQPGESFA